MFPATAPNLTDALKTIPEDIPLFPPGLNPLALLVHILTHPKVRDWAQLIFLGFVAEATRRWSKHVWFFIQYWISITSIHKPSDESHDWLMAYWVSTPSWIDKCRRFECETSMISAGQRSYPWLVQKSGKGKEKTSGLDRRAAPDPHLIPPIDTSHWIFYRGRLVRFWRRDRQNGESLWDRGSLEVTIFGFSRNVFQDLVKEAKQIYCETDADKVQVSVIDEKNEGGWRQIATRNKRPLNTVITEDGVIDKVCTEVQEFLDTEGWYIARGVPWRRGYLLHGTPGSGKTSLIHALASHLDLRIYVVSLASTGLTDSKLNRCMTLVPAGAIVVMEDIDVSMPKGGSTLQRDDGEVEPEEDVKEDKKEKGRGESGNSVTLSGLLNAIDGVAGAEGRILFMTTNHKEKLDKALIRPGRADSIFEFRNASKLQAKKLFKIFYPLDGKFPLKHARQADALYAAAVTGGEKPGRVLDPHTINELADRFAALIPDRDFSVADLQCLLLKYKAYPGDAVDAVPSWVEEKRQEKLRDEQRAQEEAEAKAKAQAIRRAKKNSLNVVTIPEPRFGDLGVTVTSVKGGAITTGTNSMPATPTTPSSEVMVNGNKAAR